MATIVPLDQAHLPQWEARLEKLRPEAPARFGKLCATGMLGHLQVLLRISLEEESHPDISNFVFRRRAFHWFFVEVLPWPKGKVQAPDYLTPPPAVEFAAAREELRQKMRQFAEACAADPSRHTRSPFLGPLPLRFWARLHGKHQNHHFEQFGI